VSGRTFKSRAARHYNGEGQRTTTTGYRTVTGKSQTESDHSMTCKELRISKQGTGETSKKEVGEIKEAIKKTI
jgi:hypothetical protein